MQQSTSVSTAKEKPGLTKGRRGSAFPREFREFIKKIKAMKGHSAFSLAEKEVSKLIKLANRLEQDFRVYEDAIETDKDRLGMKLKNVTGGRLERHIKTLLDEKKISEEDFAFFRRMRVRV
jgi:hypothetical protein